MVDRLDEAANEAISSMNQRMGLQALLQVPIVKEIYGWNGGADFYRSTIGVLNRLIEVAKARGLTPIVKEHTARLSFAQSMLEQELQRTPIPATASDAEPTMRYDPETGQSRVVVGGGSQEGGYAIELNPSSEYRMIRR